MSIPTDAVGPRLAKIAHLPQGWMAQQPLKAIYIIQTLLSGLLLHPLWIVFHILGVGNFPRSYSLKETLRIRLMRYIQFIIPRCDLYPNVLDHNKINIIDLNKKLKETKAIWVGAPSDESKWFKGIAVKKGCEPQRILASVWGKNAKAGRGLDVNYNKGEKVFLYLHGGGLAAGSALESDDTAEIPRQILKGGNVQHALSADYRKINSGPFPMQLVDCITAWAYLVDTVGAAPSDILLGGDSAGAHLTLCLTRYLRDELQTELPARLFLSSPWVAMHNSLGPSASLHKGISHDILDFSALQPFIANRLILDNPISLLDSAWLSPASPTCPATEELFANFPPSFVISTAQEALTDESREVVRRMKLSKVEVVTYEEPEAPHDFICFDWVNKDKRQRAWLRINQWIGQQWVNP